MSLILLAACTIAASASAAGFALGRRRGKPPREAGSGPTTAASTGGRPAASNPSGTNPLGASRPAASEPNERSIVMDSLPFTLGDVVAFDRQERWLAGAIAAFDGSAIAAAVFFAPEGSAIEVVAAFPAPRRSILWLTPVEIDMGHEAPTSLEVSGVLLQRKRRIPVQLKRAGQVFEGAPAAGDTATLAEYAATGGDAALILRTGERCFGWFGRELQEGEYDRMGKGTASP